MKIFNELMSDEQVNSETIFKMNNKELFETLEELAEYVIRYPKEEGIPDEFETLSDLLIDAISEVKRRLV
ncbi:hypothetical protein [Bacillus badius]|uniref:hypothetical protein n=1 Tax=Bacillus badius TaxID=1455 RepID=UPI000597246B|nr:hypothetical protein [Bacillus badius]KIL74344.1 hypothetical protein SD78_1413 [Bacillus badius]